MTGTIPALRDIHLPASPGWWPPAPGWWMLAILLAVALAWSVRRMLRMLRRRRRVRYALHAYDNALANANDAPARLAAVSQLLRRAAMTSDQVAAQLDGDAWLRFLDGDDPTQPFSNAPGSLLRDGGFRRVVDEDIAPTLALARVRFVALLERDHA
ncbi:MAG TPA: DUF4381 domain-containing protein [Xanthomonadaceae bacterium]|jgi:hypothetical protein|nr:DUF4381 domain-containing protein [Xanthomonadaceae bacterium]